jgi:putative Mg2+ transporter-C (MgtC) family protein
MSYPASAFLGAGVSVPGINTAATIWCSAAVDVLASAGYAPAATIGTALILLAHLALRPVARRLDGCPPPSMPKSRPSTASALSAKPPTRHHPRWSCRP